MNPLKNLLASTGKWRGINCLWTSPDQPPDESASVVNVAPALGGRFVHIDQSWAYEGKPQEGSLLIGCDGETKIATVHWIDTFHMGCKVMNCAGIVTTDGTIDVRGGYAAPPGPDWGWRMQIPPVTEGQLEIVMYNIHPDGKQELAVRAGYLRT